MRSIAFSLFAALSFLFTHAQQGQMEITGTDSRMGGSVRFYDPGAVGTKKAEPLALSDIYGTPFWDDHWNPGYLILRNNTIVKLHDIRLNQFSHQVHYLDGSNELVTEPFNVKKVILLKARDTNQLLARFEAFPDPDDDKHLFYYRVANEGKYRLLELQKATVKISPYDPGMQKAESKWLTKSYYAIAEYDLLHPLVAIDKEEVGEILKSEPAAMEWLKKNKLRNASDLVTLLNQINSH